jgi:hypothetical protein
LCHLQGRSRFYSILFYSFLVFFQSLHLPNRHQKIIPVGIIIRNNEKNSANLKSIKIVSVYFFCM